MLLLPSPPEGMFNVSADAPPSVYLLGNTTFRGSNFHINSFLHRSLTPLDDFIYGVLSVLLITFLADIVLTVLLRSSGGTASLPGVLSAFLLTEFSQLRSFMRHFRRIRERYRMFTRWSGISVFIVALPLAVALFAADVLIIVFSQPSTVRSLPSQYTIETIQPVAADINLADRVASAANLHPCVIPAMEDGPQRRNFVIVICFTVTSSDHDPNVSSNSTDSISIASWLHEGGADHNITFETGWIHISLRAQIIMAKSDGGARRLIFHVDDFNQNAPIRYVHDMVMYHAQTHLCENVSNPTPTWCSTAGQEVKASSVTNPVLEIILWAGRNNDTSTNITGLQSTYNDVTMADPHNVIQQSLKPLFASAAMVERKQVNHSYFTRLANDSDYTDALPGLLAEERRPLSVAFLAVITVVCFSVLMILRLILQPLTLSMVAVHEVSSVDEQSVRVDGWGLSFQARSTETMENFPEALSSTYEFSEEDRSRRPPDSLNSGSISRQNASSGGPLPTAGMSYSTRVSNDLSVD